MKRRAQDQRCISTFSEDCSPAQGEPCCCSHLICTLCNQHNCIKRYACRTCDVPTPCLQSALAKFGTPASAAVSSAPSPAIGKRVGLVTLLLPDGGQQTYDAVLVGADRARGG
jgi:hypothetical protein